MWEFSQTTWWVWWSGLRSQSDPQAHDKVPHDQVLNTGDTDLCRDRGCRSCFLLVRTLLGREEGLKWNWNLPWVGAEIAPRLPMGKAREFLEDHPAIGRAGFWGKPMGPLWGICLTEGEHSRGQTWPKGGSPEVTWYIDCIIVRPPDLTLQASVRWRGFACARSSTMCGVMFCTSNGVVLAINSRNLHTPYCFGCRAVTLMRRLPC